MGLIDSLRGKIVGLDAAPLIYYIEDHPTYRKIVDPFFDAMERGEITVVTSSLTLLETLVLPIRRSDQALAQKYRDVLLDTEGLVMIDFSQTILEEAAKLRAFHNVRTPDAIQIATAIVESADFFLTNDKKLPSLPNLTMLVVDNIVLGEETEEESSGDES